MKSSPKTTRKGNFWYTEKGRNFLVEQYSNLNKSPYEIAEEAKVYPNLIRRALTFHGIKLRDRSDAQKQALTTGRAKHPTLGTHRDQKTRNKIGDKIRQCWENMSDDEYYRIAEQRKERWDNLPAEHKRDMLKKAAQKVRKTATEGSALEKYLFACLIASGYNPVFHKEKIVDAEKMHVDIYIPGDGIAIEIDGPSHFLPIYSEEALRRRTKADDHKTALLLKDGHIVLRVRNLIRKNSESLMREFSKSFMEAINALSKNPPIDIKDRLITIDFGTIDNWKELKG